MKINDKGKKILMDSESFEPKAYYATDLEKSKGIVSIGYGFTYYADGSKVKINDVISKEDADLLLENILVHFENKVKSLVKVNLNSNQFSALVSLVYNIGGTNFSNSSLLKFVNKKEFANAANEFEKWNKQNKRVLKGLVKRRKLEKELFLS